METYFAYGYELPKKGVEYLCDRIVSDKDNQLKKKRVWTSIVKKIKKVDREIYILYTCNKHKYVVRLLR